MKGGNRYPLQFDSDDHIRDRHHGDQEHDYTLHAAKFEIKFQFRLQRLVPIIHNIMAYAISSSFLG